jgi:uncharacterized protein (TIGR00369 family)
MTVKKVSAARLRRIQKAIDSVPYAHLLGIELRNLEPGGATLGFKISKEHMQNQGVVHGGAIASLIDTTMAIAILSELPRGQRVTTVDLNICYLRPLTHGSVTAVARVIRMGRRLITVSAEVFDDAGSLASTSLSTYIRLS